MTYDDFIALVQRYRASDVTALCGAVSAKAPLGDTDEDGRPYPFPGFALAGVARAAIVHGAEYGHVPINAGRLRRLTTAFLNVDDPVVANRDIRAFLVRTGAEQFPYQASPHHDVARTAALLEDCAAATPAQSLINLDFWRNVLGCTPREFVGVSFFLWASAVRNAGRFSVRWLDRPGFVPVFREVSRNTITAVFENQFLASMKQFRDIESAHYEARPQFRKFAFNPLLIRPFVQHYGRGPICPVARGILLRATPGSLYYTAIKRYGRDFAAALGLVFERYVGQQLQLSAPQLLIHDREYGSGKKAVDFIVVLPLAVVLVEAKITPLTYEAKLGPSQGGASVLDADYDKAAGKGMEQIEQTAQLIRQRHSAFCDVPTDRPLVGLVVTLEPYYACEVALPTAGGTMNKWLSNVRELEYLVCLRGRRLDEVLIEAAASGKTLGQMILSTRRTGRNPILDAAWESCPFGRMGASEVNMAPASEVAFTPQDA